MSEIFDIEGTISELFEIEIVQEIWRTPDLTFTVVYPTHTTAAIKGMRGESFSRQQREEIGRIMKLKGISKVLFEKKRVNEFQEKVLLVE